MSKNFVMLAGKYDPAKARFPYYASEKLDGVRAFIEDGQVWSRRKELIPNLHVQALFSHQRYAGLDGELIVGPPNSPTAFNDTQSGVMRIAGEPNVMFHVFDYCATTQMLFTKRLLVAKGLVQGAAKMKLVKQHHIRNQEELDRFESCMVADGYEGVMLRTPESLYKFGRSTVNESYLLKVKRFEDADAVILSYEEENHNANEKIVNEYGVGKRSSAKAGKVGKGVLGKLLVEDTRSGVQFGVGSGFTAAQRANLWDVRTTLPGCYIKYRYQPAGVKEKPRFPTFIGMRDERDM